MWNLFFADLFPTIWTQQPTNDETDWVFAEIPEHEEREADKKSKRSPKVWNQSGEVVQVELLHNCDLGRTVGKQELELPKVFLLPGSHFVFGVGARKEAAGGLLDVGLVLHGKLEMELLEMLKLVFFGTRVMAWNISGIKHYQAIVLMRGIHQLICISPVVWLSQGSLQPTWLLKLCFTHWPNLYLGSRTWGKMKILNIRSWITRWWKRFSPKICIATTWLSIQILSAKRFQLEKQQGSWICPVSRC